ncbi:MAG TPA: CRISPR-associated endonuclease Cas1 [Desulfobacterales bacterium]|nr:CRISPR-associated endonuclease Cas1 [Desulfobacterales bacterium]
MVRRIYIREFGLTLGVSGEQFVVRRRKEVVAKIPAVDVHVIEIMTDRASLTTAALRLAARHGVWIVIADYLGRPQAFLEPITRRAGIIIRRRQYDMADTTSGLELAKRLALGKMVNQRNILRRLAARRKGKEIYEILLDLYLAASEEVKALVGSTPGSREFIMNFEARVARLYWEAWSAILENFPGRRKRYENPEDPINMALNLGYSLLEADCYIAISSTNLDPYAGFLHVDNPRRPALVMDFMEQFRQPIVDSIVLTLAERGMLEVGEGRLSKNSVNSIIKSYADRLRQTVSHRGRRAPLEAHILYQARHLEDRIRIGSPIYTPFTVR